MRATVIADASFCSKTKHAGWAFWIAPDVGPKVQRFGAFKTKPKTSGEAELWAALNGVHVAIQRGATFILLQSDCQGIWGKKKFQRVWLPLCQEHRVRIEYRHVKGHTMHGDPRYYVNRWCDVKARQVMRAMRDGRKLESSAHIPCT